VTAEAVRREIVLDAPLEDVWVAVSAPEHLGAWFGAEVDFEPRPGAALSFRFPDGSARRGVVESVEPPRRLVIRWRPVRVDGAEVWLGDASTVELTLEPAADGRTRVLVAELPAVPEAAMRA
jgi:uncharacterized protein YndB with AHSA1/START domain